MVSVSRDNRKGPSAARFTASAVTKPKLTRDPMEADGANPSGEPRKAVTDPAEPAVVRGSSTSSSDDWAFPERPFDRLTRKQQRRRHKEILMQKNRVDTRTKEELDAHRYGNKFMELMRPVFIFLCVQGRFPFHWRDNLDGTFSFSGGWEMLRAIWFNAVSWIVTAAIGCTIYNAMGIVLNWGPYQLDVGETRIVRVRERVIINRYINLYFSCLGCLIHHFFVSLNVYFKADITLRYLSYWTEALQSLKIDVTPGLFVFRNRMLVLFGAFMLVMVTFGCLRLTASAAGGASVMGYLMFRMTKSDLLLNGENFDGTYFNPWWVVIQTSGGLVFFMSLIWSKGFIFLFMLKVKSLRNAMATWNGRLYSALLRGGQDARLESGRTTIALLFRDHGTILDLIESSDEFFGVIIESYLFTQLWTICFENYFFIRSLKYGFRYRTSFYRRGPEIVTAFLTCIHDLVTLYFMLKLGSEVGEESMAGFEVIRRRTMMGVYDDEEFCFMMSLYASYAGHRLPKLQGCGFFYFSKAVMGAVFGVIGVFTVIVFQFQPNFDYNLPEDKNQGGYWVRILEPWTNPFMCKSWTLLEKAYKECFRSLELDGFSVSKYYLSQPKLDDHDYVV